MICYACIKFGGSDSNVCLLGFVSMGLLSLHESHLMSFSMMLDWICGKYIYIYILLVNG